MAESRAFPIDDDAAAKVADYRGLFCTPVLTADLPDADGLVAELRRVILQRRGSHAGGNRSSEGGWQSDTEMLQWGGAAARQLGILMVQMCSRFTRDIGQTDPMRPRFEWSGEMWANICPPGVGHESHTHPGSLWAAVFYVDDGLAEGDNEDAAGFIVLQDPRNPTPVMYKPDLRFVEPDGGVYRSDQRIPPKAGRLIAFPAWVAHWVTPHRGRRDRISIALNTVALAARQETEAQSAPSVRQPAGRFR